MSERADFAAWAELMSKDVIIWHNGSGETFRLSGCGTCKGVAHREYPSDDPSSPKAQWLPCVDCGGVVGNPMDVVDGVIQPVSGYPMDHPMGKCFPCSGVRGPKPQKVRATAGSGLMAR